MEIFPNCKQLMISMYCCSAIGCFPSQLMFKNYKTYQKAYSLYGKVVFTYYVWLMCTIYMELSHSLSIDEVSGILSVGLINSATVFRQWRIRFDNRFIKLVQRVIDMERAIYSIQLPEIVDAYNAFVKKYNKNCKAYLYFMAVLTLNFSIRPMLVAPVKRYMGNETVITKALPFPCWLPFDKQKHYEVAYVVTCLNCLLGACSVAISDVFMCTLIVHPLGLLTVFRHILVNFEKLAQIRQNKNKSLNIEEAEYYTLIDIIEWHIEIIEFIEEYNNVMNGVMLFDFLQSSVQVAFIVVQVIESGITPLSLAFVLSYILTMLFRLVMYYYYGNEVTFLSERLAYDVWDDHWFDKDPKIIFMMRVFIMRCQKSLAYRIGPFGTLSLAALLSLLRTTYSYIMLLNGFSHE